MAEVWSRAAVMVAVTAAGVSPAEAIVFAGEDTTAAAVSGPGLR